jgi:hypothetical protein
MSYAGYSASVTGEHENFSTLILPLSTTYPGIPTTRSDFRLYAARIIRKKSSKAPFCLLSGHNSAPSDAWARQ